jgi:flagellar assembly protein FliH
MLIKHKNLNKIHGASNVVHIEPAEATRAVQMELHKAKQEAKAITQQAEAVLEESRKKLEDAETKAAVIIDSANKQAEAIKQKVYNETLSVAKTEADEIRSQSKDLLLELFEVKKQVFFQAHSEIIKVALDLAEKIIKYQVTIDPNVLRTQVIEAIKKATSEADRVQVYVHPQDLKKLEQSINDLEKLFPSGIDIIPLTNDSVDPGSCIVETKSGQLDARFSTQLKSLSDLVSKTEIEKPQISTVEDAQLVPEISNQESIFLEDESLLLPLKEPSILADQVQEENIVQEVSEIPEAGVIQPFTSDEEMLEIPQEIVEKVKDIEKIEENILEEDSSLPDLKKKKIFSDDLMKRTKEEEEELNETIEFEEEEEAGEEEEEKEKKIRTEGILKPKKPLESSQPPQKPQISDIASELEKSPEWKDLLQGEDEE